MLLGVIVLSENSETRWKWYVEYHVAELSIALFFAAIVIWPIVEEFKNKDDF